MSGEQKIIAGTVVSSITILGALLYFGNKQTQKIQERESKPLAGHSHEIEGRTHVHEGEVEDSQDPPTSGDHYGFGVAGAGMHNEPVDDGLTVHSLEHGAVVLHFDPNNLTGNQIQQLKDIFTNDFRGKKIMMPRPDMSKPIVMTSWGQSLKLDSINKEEMTTFMNTNNDRGPEKASNY